MCGVCIPGVFDLMPSGLSLNPVTMLMTDSQIDKTASVDPTATLSDKAVVILANAVVKAGAKLEHGAQVGEGCSQVPATKAVVWTVW